jgi:hypothetical protein
MSNLKAVSFLLFASLIVLGATFFLKSQAGIIGGIVAVALGIFILSLFSKIFAK